MMFAGWDRFLYVWDLAGVFVKSLVDDALPPDLHDAVWEGGDARGNRVGSGLYFYQFRESGLATTKKILLLR